MTQEIKIGHEVLPVLGGLLQVGQLGPGSGLVPRVSDLFEAAQLLLSHALINQQEGIGSCPLAKALTPTMTFSPLSTAF